MPRFKDDASRESYIRSRSIELHRRKLYAAEKLIEELPTPREAPITKELLFERATESARRNGLLEDRYFGKTKNPPNVFRRFIENHWGGVQGIVLVMQNDLGIFVERGHGLTGVRRANKRGAEASTSWLAKCNESTIEVYNLVAEGAKTLLGIQAPILQVRRLLK